MVESASRILAAKQAEVRHSQKVVRAHELKEAGYSNAAIARDIGMAESTVRRMLREPRG